MAAELPSTPALCVAGLVRLLASPTTTLSLAPSATADLAAFVLGLIGGDSGSPWPQRHTTMATFRALLTALGETPSLRDAGLPQEFARTMAAVAASVDALFDFVAGLAALIADDRPAPDDPSPLVCALSPLIPFVALPSLLTQLGV